MTTLPPTAPEPLARLLRERPKAPPGECCEMCTEPVAAEHSHIVDTTSRQLMCACRPCAMLFTDPGAGRGRFRTVPDRWLHEPGFSLTGAQWERFQIPVSLAFFFKNSVLGKVIAFYPSPAGATESLLSLEAWTAATEGSRLVEALEPDVEALIVFRDTRRDATSYACHLVPIDRCYELVGRVRLRWRGFDGGTEAWDEIHGFFDGIDERSRPIADG